MRPYFPPGWYMSTVNTLEQATIKQIADFLDYNYDHVRQKMREAVKPPDGSRPFFNVLIPLTRLKQVRGSVPLVFGLSKRGKDHLEYLDYEVLQRHAFTDRVARPHILAVNEVLIHAIKLARENPWLTLNDTEQKHNCLQIPWKCWYRQA